jgi:hypothetical protein
MTRLLRYVLLALIVWALIKAARLYNDPAFLHEAHAASQPDAGPPMLAAFWIGATEVANSVAAVFGWCWRLVLAIFRAIMSVVGSLINEFFKAGDLIAHQVWMAVEIRLNLAMGEKPARILP